MKRIIQSLLFVGITAILPQFAFSQVKPEAPTENEISLYQDRVWTNIDGKKVTARAVAKTQDKVTLRMTDGKRVQVAIDQLSKKDSEWLANWSQPTFKVSSKMMELDIGTFKVWSSKMNEIDIVGRSINRDLDAPSIKKPTIKKRIFKIGSLIMYEDEFPDMIAALNEFIKLASKPLTDIDSYKKLIYKSKYNNPYRYYSDKDYYIDTSNKNDAYFTVGNGKPLLTGSAFCVYRGSGLTPEQVLQHLDFLEIFSVRDWDKQQEEIKRRFEKRSE